MILDEPTNFYIGATGNPGAPDLEIERQKISSEKLKTVRTSCKHNQFTI